MLRKLEPKLAELATVLGIVPEGRPPVPPVPPPVQLYLKRRINNNSSMQQRMLTLTPPPTQTNPASTDWEALHLFNGPLCIRLANELHEATVLSDGNFHLCVCHMSGQKGNRRMDHPT